MLNLLILATEEGVPGDHIAADIVPIIGALFFCGSVYVLLWSIYGWKKGALVYGTAFFAFGFLLGLFWWFGAPGTPLGTGLINFPGQAPDRYTGKWLPMEPGSDRAQQFDVTNFGLGEESPFQTPEEAVGMADASEEELEQNPRYRSLAGDLESAADRMLELFLPESAAGTPLIGANLRQQLEEEAPDPPPGRERASPFLSARVRPVEEGSDDAVIAVTEERGLRIAAAPLQIVGTFVNADPEAPPDPQPVVLHEVVWYAVKDPGALWFPAAVWTVVSALLFAACLFGLDLMERREKRLALEREPVVSSA